VDLICPTTQGKFEINEKLSHFEIDCGARQPFAIGNSPDPNKKGGAGAPPLSGADWLLVNRQTTISEVEIIS
jgi:hypothetical protein